jgi:dTDP-4-amino-4,6-dideoxygalactose transaminase
VTRHIPFNRPHEVGTEAERIEEAIGRGHLSADGHFSRLCQTWLQERTGAVGALMMHSCTAALEAAAILSGVGPGDEVIVPSYTFVTTASSFALRGATPVFVDVEPATLNIDPAAVAAAVSPATRAIVAVHYAGIAADLDALAGIADKHELMLIEDAAQGCMAYDRGRALGSIGQLGALSFHETKNLTCGEGGALLVNDERLLEAAEIVCDKGTNRRRFMRGDIDRYTWLGLGSSFGLSDLNAAFLWEQFQYAESITERRVAVWQRYHEAFEDLERRGAARRPIVPDGRVHNGHLYYLIVESRTVRDRVLAELEARGVNAVFHYVPLHSSPAGSRLGRTHGSLEVTDDLSGRLVRLPLWADLPPEDLEYIVDAVRSVV